MRLFRLLPTFCILLVLIAVVNKKSLASELKPDTLSGGVVRSEGYYLPRAMNIPCTLMTPIDTRVSQVGDPITVKTAEDILIDEYNLIPAQSFLHGKVSKLVKPKNRFRNAKIEIDLNKITIPGQNRDLEQTLFIKARITAKETASKAVKVSDGVAYNAKLKKAAGAGALAGGGSALAASMAAGLQVSSNLTRGVALLGAVGGAMVGASLLTRDDMRLETGTELVAMIEKATVYDYNPGISYTEMARNNVSAKELENANAQTYDRIMELRSYEL